MTDKLLEAQDTISRGKDLAQALSMMGEAVGEDAGNAIVRVANDLIDTLSEASDLLDEGDGDE